MTQSVRMVRVVISGRVQGVGYRAWAQREAMARGLKGWVRNRANGDVEAVFVGDAADVASICGACREGPRFARVDHVAVADADDAAWSDPCGDDGFAVLGTV